MKFFRVLCFCALALISRAQAQLAITEAMSSASTNKGPETVVQNSDYWELTNFGPTPMDLTGYRFFDSAANLAGADPTLFEGLIIGAGESVLFVQSAVSTNLDQVREWWGPALGTNVQIRFYANPGFSSTGDGVRIWAPGATDQNDVVDSVDFAEAQRGSSFVYHPETGEFGIYATNGVGGAFQAATADDIGSPGRNTGPTPLRITQQPAAVVVNAGDTARLTVAAQGRPRARVQWYFDETLLEGATRNTLEIPDVQAPNAGLYHAKLSNGVTNLNSVSVQVVLQSQSSAPAFTAVPTNFTLTIGQGHLFHSHATGVPQPTYQWQFMGTNIAGATAEDFQFSATGLEQTGSYSVIATNARGAVTNQFTITVTAPPALVITEVMSSEIVTNVARVDWWELTNVGTNSYSLQGYRFDDNSEALAQSYTITNDIVIAPGESIIFTEGMTADAFRAWWGETNLPAGLRIFPYSGGGLGLSSTGDAINLWNAAAVDNFDKVASAVFSIATAGVSFRYNPDTRQFGEKAALNTFGAFAAAVGGDIGSPGYVTTPAPKPNITAFVRAGAVLSITWTAVSGKTYQLQSRDSASVGEWTVAKTVTAAAASQTEEAALEPGITQRFYRIFAP